MPPKTLQPVAGKMKKSKSTSSVPTTAAELDVAGTEEQSPPSDKLRMKEVIAACRVAVSHQQSNEDPEVARALQVLQMFADLKEKEAQNAIGYSRVKREMLDDLSIKMGFLRLDKVAAKKDAAQRKLPLTERFCQDKAYYRDGGLSKVSALLI
ncbi:hypothetical protein EYR40_003022 [Pleurotus pulmonarius]|nr:hypothetical protein EYR36_005470 [Pleurotus pulmonarius]KAF4580624.1 hypothetical protein EYR40_003022 [Pleurotus pulmonarius]